MRTLMKPILAIVLLAASAFAQEGSTPPVSSTPPTVTILQAEKELLQAQNLNLQTQIMVMRAEQKLADVKAKEEAKRNAENTKTKTP